ncbi:MAG TPA: hypothetical protein VG051_05360 [Candidatus Acidoferrum sp.]|jgi:hypothetical protein|nr:hypothetical protein [Candidatus Acidoferrum sp.]
MGSCRVRLAVLIGAIFFICTGMFAADKVQELQARFDRETDAVRKAKIFEKLGDAQFEEARKSGQAGDYSVVGLTMERYRDDARAALDALKKNQPDAERHPNGYKQLQYHVHRGLRELEEILVVAPVEYRPPLRLVRQDLGAINDELLHMLFPRRPGEHPPTPPPAGKQP